MNKKLILAILILLIFLTSCSNKEEEEAVMASAMERQSKLHKLIFNERVQYYKNLPDPIMGRTNDENQYFFEVTLHLGYLKGDDDSSLLFKTYIKELSEATRIFFSLRSFDELNPAGKNYTPKEIEEFNGELKEDLLKYLRSTLEASITDESIKKKYDKQQLEVEAYLNGEINDLKLKDYTGILDVAILNLVTFDGSL